MLLYWKITPTLRPQIEQKFEFYKFI